MSKKLLTDLNGNKTGKLKKFIDDFKAIHGLIFS